MNGGNCGAAAMSSATVAYHSNVPARSGYIFHRSPFTIRNMHVTELEFDPKLILGPADQLVRDGMDANLGPRSPGLHLSQVYYDIERTIVPKDEEDAKFSEQDLEFYRAMGYLWERMLANSLVDGISGPNLIRPGEFTRDGITGSPDLIDISTWTLVESKATWRSERKLDNLHKFFWIWLVQMMGYCYILDTPRARLVAFFVNGNWAPPKPNIRILNFTFTQRELNENWLMLTTHAKKRGWL